LSTPDPISGVDSPRKLPQFIRQQAGFTLIELMVTIGILALLLGLAAPNFADTVRRSKARDLSNDLLSSLTFARQQAISTNQCVTICMVASATAANPVCATSGTDWERGWIVFANPLCDNVPGGVGADILKIHNGVDANGPSITPVGSGVNARRIKFNPVGSILLAEAKDFTVVTQAPIKVIGKICVAATGRVRRIAQEVPDDCDPP
jgi:type IV fimbrial biogenesis protein FimT